MAVNYNLGSRLSTSRSSQAGASSKQSGAPITYGRVTDVVVDAFHPLYNENGKSQALYGVEYISATTSADNNEDAEKSFAWCGTTFFKRLPIKNEIVLIISGPSSDYRDEGASTLKRYWIDILPIWNHTHHNGYPDTFQDGEGDANFGKDFEEQSAINNLQMFPGDVVIESRHGSSLRFGGTKFESNKIIDSSNNGKPYTIIRNGQIETKDGLDTVLEDINKDPSSIYLSSDHKFELKQANTKRKALEEAPEEADQYKGNQVIINAGRLFFNSKEESILMSSKEQIGINASEVGIDADKYIGLDAKRIYLGEKGFREDEPVLLGQTTIEWLDDFLSQMENLTKTLATLPPAPPAAIVKIIATSASIFPSLKVLRQKLKLNLSKKVYTE
jgi:hypothetical protein|tara:strand:- start:12947 stop:14110 length:1164 start_codon:yes stop_codon:yes gene_type:complete